MLPTVGCEADATSFVEDKREFDVMASEPADPAPPSETAAASSSGPGSTGRLQCGRVHYAAGPAALPRTGKVVLEGGAMVAPGKRVRLRVPLRKWNEEKNWVAEKLEVVSENYSSTYKGGRELPMSCGAEAGFSGEPAVAEAVVAGVQEAADAVESGHAWCAALQGRDAMHTGPDGVKHSACLVSPFVFCLCKLLCLQHACFCVAFSECAQALR